MIERDQEWLDEELIQALRLIEKVPQRDPKRVALGKAIFLDEVDAIIIHNQHRGKPEIIKPQKDHWWKPKIFPPLAPRLTIALIMICVFLFGGVMFTAYAAQTALPGDSLYQVKTSLERTRTKLNPNAQSRMDTYLNFAENRIEEIRQLIQDGRFSDISQAALGYTDSIQQALENLQTIAQNDPQQAVLLSAQLTNRLQDYARSLYGFLSQLPASEQLDVERMIILSTNPFLSEDELVDHTLIGKIEKIDGKLWTINGFDYLSDEFTYIEPSVGVGKQVRIIFTIDNAGNAHLHLVSLIEEEPTGNKENGNVTIHSGDGNDSSTDTPVINENGSEQTEPNSIDNKQPNENSVDNNEKDGTNGDKSKDEKPDSEQEHSNDPGGSDSDSGE